MKTEQPLWGRGQMVSPQHFQQQAAYAAWSAECIARFALQAYSNNFANFASHCGCAGQAGAVTRLPST